MGTITERRAKNGNIRYRAVIRVRKNQIDHSESRTFSKKSLAEQWLKKREAEIELNPESITKAQTQDIRLSDAIIRYLDEMGDNFGRTHTMSLKFIAKLPIGAKYISKLTKADYSSFAEARLAGTYQGTRPITPQTLSGDIISIRTVLRHARLVWGLDVDIQQLEDVVLGLRYARKIKASDKRNRLPTNEELYKLTEDMYRRYVRYKNPYPMHLVLWFAIYSCRRESEITRLDFDDFDGEFWLVRDAKNPKGSMGNHKHVKLPERALAMIDEIKHAHTKMLGLDTYNKKLLFPLNAQSISARFTQSCHIAGIHDLRFHDLRHEGATRLAEQGLSIPQIQLITGHDSWSSLQRYTNLKQRPDVLEYDDIINEIKNKYK